MAGSERSQPSWTPTDWQMLPLTPNWRRPPFSVSSEQAVTTATTIKRMHRHKQRHRCRSSKSEGNASIDSSEQAASDNENGSNESNSSSGSSSSSSSSSSSGNSSCSVTSAGCVSWWNYRETGDDAQLLPVSARTISQGRREPRFGDDGVGTAPMPSMTTKVKKALSPLPLPLTRSGQMRKRKGKRRTSLVASLLCFPSWPMEARGALAMFPILFLLALTLILAFGPVGRSLATIVSAAKLAAQNESGEFPEQQQQPVAESSAPRRVVGDNSTQQQQSPPSASGPLSLANESRLVKVALSSVMLTEPTSALQSNDASNTQKQQQQEFQMQLQLQQQQLHQRQQHPTNLAPTSSIINANLTGSDLQHQLQLQQESNSAANMAVMTIADEFALQQQAIRANENAGEDYSDLERYVIIGVIILDIVIFIIGFCGNTVVILVILKFTKVESVTDVYILNLAFADLMFLTGLLFLMITMFIERWIFGALMCKLYMATTSLNQFASSLLLVVMSFDRFLAVCHPFYAQRFRRLGRAKVICLCIWIICWILMTPILTFAKIDNRRMNEMTCTIIWPEYEGINYDVAFTLYSFTIGFAGPLFLIAIFHVCVIRKLRLAASGRVSVFSTRRSRTRESTNRRVEHLVIGIICTYTICWLPYWIGQLGVSFTITDNSPVRRFWCLYLVATSLEYFNSALNPILYAFLSDNFKRRCSDIVRSCAKWWLLFREVICNARGGGGGGGGNERGSGYNGGSEPQHHRLGASTTTACYELEPSQPEFRLTSAAFLNNRGGGSSNSEAFSRASYQDQRRQSSQKSTTPIAAGARNRNSTVNGADCGSGTSTSSSDCGCSGFGGCLSATSNSNNNNNYLARKSSNLAPTNNATSSSANVNQTSLLLQSATASQLVATSSPDSKREASAYLVIPAAIPTQSNFECLASSIKSLAVAGSSGCNPTGSSSAKVQTTAMTVAATTIDSSGNQRKKSVAFSSIDTVVVHNGIDTSSSTKNHLTMQQQHLQQFDKADGGKCQGI